MRCGVAICMHFMFDVTGFPASLFVCSLILRDNEETGASERVFIQTRGERDILGTEAERKHDDGEDRDAEYYEVRLPALARLPSSQMQYCCCCYRLWRRKGLSCSKWAFQMMDTIMASICGLLSVEETRM